MCWSRCGRITEVGLYGQWCASCFCPWHIIYVTCSCHLFSPWCDMLSSLFSLQPEDPKRQRRRRSLNLLNHLNGPMSRHHHQPRPPMLISAQQTSEPVPPSPCNIGRHQHQPHPPMLISAQQTSGPAPPSHVNISSADLRTSPTLPR